MNTHLKQLWAAMKLPEKLQKSYKFFCRGLDIRVRKRMKAVADIEATDRISPCQAGKMLLKWHMASKINGRGCQP